MEEILIALIPIATLILGFFTGQLNKTLENYFLKRRTKNQATYTLYIVFDQLKREASLVQNLDTSLKRTQEILQEDHNIYFNISNDPEEIHDLKERLLGAIRERLDKNLTASDLLSISKELAEFAPLAAAKLHHLSKFNFGLELSHLLGIEENNAQRRIFLELMYDKIIPQMKEGIIEATPFLYFNRRRKINKRTQINNEEDIEEMANEMVTSYLKSLNSHSSNINYSTL
ncbi:MAG: hypothetical protein HWD92_06575 [Flavobacteriia bacterium]|nr:hypothetical protein [Flavobacteriia bacterium]